MSSITCYGSDGSILSHYTQWDINQKLIIRGADETTAPQFHFSNCLLENAIVTTSVITELGIISDVPDVLFYYPFPIIVHLYYENDDTGFSKYSVRIPVHPKKIPNDFIFNGNTGDGNDNGSSNESNFNSAQIIISDSKPQFNSVLWFNTSLI